LQPEFIGKVDPPALKIKIPKHEKYHFDINGLKYVSGTAGVEYKLKNGKYRAHVVYRPFSNYESGILSNEVTINKK
jgi:hypothetical protein